MNFPSISWIERSINWTTTIGNLTHTHTNALHRNHNHLVEWQLFIRPLWSDLVFAFVHTKFHFCIHALKRDDTPAHSSARSTYHETATKCTFSSEYIISDWAGSKWIVIIIHFLSHSHRPYVANTLCVRTHTQTCQIHIIYVVNSLWKVLTLLVGHVLWNCWTNSWCHSIVRNHSQLIALMSPISFG